MTPDPPRDDSVTPSVPDLRPGPSDRLRPRLPYDRKWFPRNRGVVRWARELGTPATADWGDAFVLVHQVQELDWVTGGGGPRPVGPLKKADAQPSWGSPEERDDGWELPFGLRLWPAHLNRLEISLKDAPWHDPPFGPPPLRRRHLRPDDWDEAISSDDAAVKVVIPPFEVIWHRRI